MSVIGIDIAWDTPTVAQILATGAHWVARYFSPDPTKNLTAAEVHDYPAAGLGIVVVWESTGTTPLNGHAAGVADAQAAQAQCVSVGLPADMPIYFAVDTDTTWPQVAPYFQGVMSELGVSRVGVYGGVQVIEGAHAAGIPFLWQTVAWSGGVWAPYATIQQPGGTTLSGGADYDTAEVPDFGQYPRPEVDPMAQFTKQDLIDAAQQGANLALQDPKNRGLAVADDLWWWQHAVTGVVPAGASAAAAAAIVAIHAEIKKLEAEPAPVAPPTPPAKA
jgi:hypothetical protein